MKQSTKLLTCCKHSVLLGVFCSAGRCSYTLLYFKLQVILDDGEKVNAPVADSLKHAKKLCICALSLMSRSVSTGCFSSYCTSLIKMKYIRNTQIYQQFILEIYDCYRAAMIIKPTTQEPINKISTILPKCTVWLGVVVLFTN